MRLLVHPVEDTRPTVQVLPTTVAVLSFPSGSNSVTVTGQPPVTVSLSARRNLSAVHETLPTTGPGHVVLMPVRRGPSIPASVTTPPGAVHFFNAPVVASYSGL